MKYVRKFNTGQEYNNFIMSESFVSPNISKVESDVNSIKYEEDAAYVNVTYNVTSTDSLTMLGNNASHCIKEIILDNDEILLPDPIANNYILYQFNTTGLHTVKVKFRKINGEYIITNDLQGAPIVKISIPSVYTNFRPSPFGGMFDLQELILPATLKTITEGLLTGTQLSSLVIPNTVKKICTGGLGSSLLTEIVIPNSVTKISNSAFGSGVKKIVFGTGITDFTPSNNSSCLIDWNLSSSNLEEIQILGNIINLPEYFLSGYNNLQTVVLPNTITHIGERAFYGCNLLNSINMPESLESIGTNAFSNCYELTSITLGNNISYIGSWAFSDCSKLTSITIFAMTPPTLADAEQSISQFSGIQNYIIYVPSEAIDTYKNDQYWSKLGDRIQPIPTE